VLKMFVKRELMDIEMAQSMLNWPHSGFHMEYDQEDNSVVTPTPTRTAETLQVRCKQHLGLTRISHLRTIAVRGALGCPLKPITAPCPAARPNCEPKSALSDRSSRRTDVAKLCRASGHVHFWAAYFTGVKETPIVCEGDSLR